MKKINNRLIGILAIIMSLALLTTIIYADSSATRVHFNIESLLAYTLTLPGEDTIVGGTDTQTADIEFNITGNQDLYSNINAKVIGGAVQDETTPIFEFDNTGTVNINISTTLNQSLPTCIVLKGATTYEGASSGDVINNTDNTTITTVFTPSATVVEWYMKANFDHCVASDSSIALLRTYGFQS